MTTTADLLEEAASVRKHYLSEGSLPAAIIRSYSRALIAPAENFEPDEIVARYEADRHNRIAEFVAATNLLKS